MKKIALISAGLILNLCLPAAYAQITPGFLPASTPAVIPAVGNLGPVNLGTVFTANANISINELGSYDLGANNNASDTIALYDSAGNLLADAAVTPSDTEVDNYFWAGISAVALTAGATYTVSEFSPNGSYGYLGTPPIVPSLPVTFNYGDYAYSGSLQFPSAQFGVNYYGPNIGVGSAVPDGGLTVLLLGMSCTGFALLRRKLC